MAKLPSVKRILPESFADLKLEWLPRLLSPINSYMEDNYRALNRGLTFTDNFAAQINSVTYTGASVKFAWNQASKPIGCTIQNVRRINGNTNITAAYALQWAWTGDSVTLTVPGLPATASDKYEITLLTITG
ncbi:MAG: hypothetical protein ACOH5I_26445 [Oligoflexus sp.]